MALRGIDIASYQGSLNLNNISYDFVVIKATQGTTYVNPACDTHFQQAKAQGKKLGVYHYADGGDAIAEADFFVNQCAGYIGQAIFVLDWEGEGVEYTDWALRFLKRVEERIGYKPVIYMSEYVINTYNWQAVADNGNGLWAAKYSDYEIDNNYDMSHAGIMPDVNWWSFYMMWQWTSKGHLNGYAGDLDCNIFYGDNAAWDAYAGTHAPAPQPQPEPTPTTTQAPPMTTTTVAPEPEPGPEPTTTTTVEPDPLPEPTTTTTTIQPEVIVPDWVPDWLVWLYVLVVVILKRLQGS